MESGACGRGAHTWSQARARCERRGVMAESVVVVGAGAALYAEMVLVESAAERRRLSGIHSWLDSRRMDAVKFGYITRSHSLFV